MDMTKIIRAFKSVPVQKLAVAGQDSEAIKTKQSPIQNFLPNVFVILHYLHEDLLLSKFHINLAKQLAVLLRDCILAMDSKHAIVKASFLWYYETLHGIDFSQKVKEVFGEDILQRLGQTIPRIEKVPILL